MRVFVTGGAGFIASNLCAKLLSMGWQVTAYDNLVLGRREFLRDFSSNTRFRFIKADLLSVKRLRQAIAGHDMVFHLACNSDIQKSNVQTDLDLKLGTLATYNVLEAMRLSGIRKIVFSSSSAIFGEPKIFPTPEDYGPVMPISFYGANKLAAEGLVSAFCHCYGFQAWVYRFANVVGKNGTHGILVDFIKKLRNNPKELVILGDGKQAKPYLHVASCVEGVLYGWRHGKDVFNVFNSSCASACNSASPSDNISCAEMMPALFCS